jgi:hypothetical protein
VDAKSNCVRRTGRRVRRGGRPARSHRQRPAGDRQRHFVGPAGPRHLSTWSTASSARRSRAGDPRRAAPGPATVRRPARDRHPNQARNARSSCAGRRATQAPGSAPVWAARSPPDSGGRPRIPADAGEREPVARHCVRCSRRAALPRLGGRALTRGHQDQSRRSHDRCNSVCPWRGGCGGTRASGSEGGGEKTGG